jgi:threonine/homoserine/homoserine lactone efflux protein
MIVTIIVVVLGSCAFFGWMAWRVCQSADRAERDPRYRRCLLLGGALLYGLSVVFGVAEVISGNAPIQSLFGLITPAALIWLFIKAASRVKVPPG